ncbi:hypothetical protein VTN96DRAFT_3700 [Rasamsonia emersonii]
MQNGLCKGGCDRKLLGNEKHRVFPRRQACQPRMAQRTSDLNKAHSTNGPGLTPASHSFDVFRLASRSVRPGMGSQAQGE